MIKINNLEIFGLKSAVYGMRLPLRSHHKADTIEETILGTNDLDLAKRLIKAGTEHRKFLRQIHITMNITAPAYWFAEMDTYKVGTTANSSSTMHKIMSEPLIVDMFSVENLRGYKNEVIQKPNIVDEDNEEWDYFPDNNLYLVSTEGRVKRLEYITTHNRRHKERILQGSLHDDGYVCINILDLNGNRKQIPKHRMVAYTFLEKKQENLVVNHIDGNKQNNSLSNLEWCTQSENIKHSIENNLQPKIVNVYKGKLTKEDRDKIIERFNIESISMRTLAKEYNVSPTTISSILNNKYNYGEGYSNEYESFKELLVELNEIRDEYLLTKDKNTWEQMIQKLPRSYNYERIITCNMEVLYNMYNQRRTHKLKEWREFCQYLEQNELFKQLFL